MEYAHELSQKLNQLYGHRFKRNQGYNNVYHLMTDAYPLFSRPERRDALYCYVMMPEGYYLRHAFCLWDGKIVEPLLNLGTGEQDLTDSILPIRELSFRQYMTLICKDQPYPSLYLSLLKDEIAVFDEYKMGMGDKLNPVDILNLYQTIVTGSIIGRPLTQEEGYKYFELMARGGAGKPLIEKKLRNQGA